eukprot:TRINITY_DN2776_c0_g1_i6.p1 TRINITY_DN2776_c0_g1~~TRINITY_DN2776_c0_g1_i6.p1  ORF type:complete len:1229 (+),score=452.93 TRINITY_DN2776_c0_g1_i6:132-3818(+)
MSTFVKPENALKRAEELIAVGKQVDALETLHAAILHRRFKNQWTQTLETIMQRHLELCVELKKIRTAREGLHQYRSTCQAANITSLEKVVKVLREAAEEKVTEAKKEQDIKLGQMADLDEMDSPETILLQAIQAGDTRQQSQDKDVHTHFRFLWDTYKVILDVLKSNNRLEDVYHETSRHCFEFCKANARPQEFKRVCDILRKNYQDLFKRTGSGPQNAVQPNNMDTITKTLETRCQQLKIATELDLWREAYFTATEICELMAKTRPKPHLRSMYYEYLGQIFWKSENYLFHAFASLKNVLFVKTAKQTANKVELELLASRALLANLCVPFQKDSDLQASLDMTSESASQNHEKAKKYTSLFSTQSVPTRNSISNQIFEKGMLNFASEPCKKLFALVESDFTPLSLCQDAKPFLDQIATDDVCEGKLKDYVTPLKQIIFFRLMKQLSEVYVSMTIADFERAANIVPFNIAEKWMANASRQQGINIQINYMQKAIVFGAASKVNMKSMRQPLMAIGQKLQQAMHRVAADELQKRDKLEKQHLLTNIRERMENETKAIRLRKDEIERRKEESEKRKQILEREAMKKQREQDEADAAAERRRLEEERKRREADRQEQKRKEAEMAKNMEMLEQMKKTADVKAVNLKVAGKKITEIEAEDLNKISFDEIEKAREAQVHRDRLDKIRARKMESKRVDHLARAIREEETPVIDDWALRVEEEDYELFEQAEERNAVEQEKKHKEGLEEKSKLIVFERVKGDWFEEKMVDRRDDYEEKAMAQTRRLQGKVVENKIARAKKRLQEYEKEQQRRREEEAMAKSQAEKRALEERRRREEEEREAERQAELERKRAADEERRRIEAEKRAEEDAARARMEEKRRAREREIEERQRQEEEKRQQDREAARNPRAAPASDAGGWRRGDQPAPAEKEGGWRSRESRDGPAAGRAPGSGRAPGGATADGDGWRSQRAGGDGPRRDAGGDSGGAWRSQRAGGDAPPRRDDGDRRDDGPRRDAGGDSGGAWRSQRAGGDAPPRRDDGPRRDAGGDSGGAWRSQRAGGDAPPRRDDGPRRDAGGDSGGAWRSQRAGGDAPPRRDDAPARGGGGRDDDAGAWRRGAASGGAGRADDKGAPGAWRSGGAGRADDKEAPGAWRSGAGRAGAAPASRGDDGPRRAPAEPAPARAEAAPKPAAQDEDDGWGTVQKKTRGAKKEGGGGGGAAGAGDAGARRPTPPWKRKPAA